MQDKHLVFLIHGLGGFPAHLDTTKAALEAQFGDDLVAHVATSNSGFRTFEGAMYGADRLCHEFLELLLKLANEGTRISRLSFVGYSYGGIWSRYLIGMLEELGVFESIEPCSLATFATPHVGTKAPKGRWTRYVVNGIGSTLVGITGRDLFWKNSVLADLSDPSQKYIKGLERFKHLELFANASWDRTVPFWTSYLTSKNVFHKRQNLELKYYDHMHGETYGATAMGRLPFFVDMDRSRYSAEATNEADGLNPVQKKRRNTFLVLLPIFFPILLTLLTVGTVMSHVRTRWHPRHDHAEEWQRVLAAWSSSTPPSPPSASASTKKADGANEADEELAGLTEEMLEQVAVSGQGNRDFGDGHISADQITAGLAAPTVGVGALEQQVPWELEIDPQIKAALANLNALKWNKYAVKLQHLNAHAEIVDRSRAKGQGAELAKFYARLMARILEEDEASSVSAPSAPSLSKK